MMRNGPFLPEQQFRIRSFFEREFCNSLFWEVVIIILNVKIFFHRLFSQSYKISRIVNVNSLSDIRKMIAEIKRHTLNFKFEAGTSRGVMTTKDSWFVKLYDNNNPERFGIGECGPLPGLSPDLHGGLEEEIQ